MPRRLPIGIQTFAEIRTDDHLIGVEFSREQRSAVGFEVETLNPPPESATGSSRP